MCLEAMFTTAVPVAVIYSAADRRRHQVTVDDELRARVIETTDRVRAMLATSRLPPAPADSRCRRCSMAAGCMPRVLSRTRHYQQALDALFTPEPADASAPDPANTTERSTG
jgi:CRISPR-associated exonuclease Cas4